VGDMRYAKFIESLSADNCYTNSIHVVKVFSILCFLFCLLYLMFLYFRIYHVW